MRLTGLPCAICNQSIRPLDSTRNLIFHGQEEKLHNRCWYENQDLIERWESQEPTLTLAAAVAKYQQSFTS